MILDLKQLKKKYNMDVNGVIHIGAHYGEEYPQYRELFGDIPIIMWEASPQNFVILNNKLKDEQNLILINKGVGPFECEVNLYKETANTGQSNSVLKPKGHTQQYPHIVFNETEKIKILPLDRWEPSSALNFINIDIQGFELQAFMGAKKTLEHVDYIMTEVNRVELYENCAQIDELDWFLKKFNFNRVETDWAGNTWGDAFYIK